ncbi:PR domain zinc finger protein 4 [Protopterus annectens]|uniref:PR domain zinc finger protein 4 n=1 Tax=Protopterus annectens TaxID=7888 RepID=UPI001CFB40E1|nr:PR domain zinc finger protein 4 [Protopterus annectens]XP_043944509.1 PR domain zinc finger protein 4 [Protopterus annectens]XP_043944510.1 PR domain zinc finger protein 4 [Protopterus annectens]XP_043944511.1 PR domain zinc finger protein 4 [Protopterus annectens]
MHNIRMNGMNLSPTGIEQLSASTVSSTLPVTGGHLGLTTSPPHNSIPTPGMPVAVPNLGATLGSVPSALSLMLPVGIGDRGVMCGIPDRNYTLPPPPYPHLESSYFRHILPGILSYLADRPPPQYIHPSSINIDSSVPPLDPYQPAGTIGLEPGVLPMDVRQVGPHSGQSLHHSDSHDVPLDTGIAMDAVPRVASPVTTISTDRVTEELTMDGVAMDGVAGENPRLSDSSRTHEVLTVDSVGNSLSADSTDHGEVIPVQVSTLELPVVMESEHVGGRANNVSENALSDFIHGVAMSMNSVSLSLSTSHPLSPLEPIALYSAAICLEPVTVSSVLPEGAMAPIRSDMASQNLGFAASSLQMEDSTSNKENVPASFTIWCILCDRAYPSDCPEHGPVTIIPDSPIESRARLSLPKVLIIKHSVTGAETGVRAREPIPPRTCFGPLIGEQVRVADSAEWSDISQNHLWKVYNNGELEFVIVTTDENECNWMMFVHKARHVEEQNLVAYPQNGKIFFCTSKEIPVDQELLFYYSRDYARQLGVLDNPGMRICDHGKECSSFTEFKSHVSSHAQNQLPSVVSDSKQKERQWMCSMCPRAFTSSFKLNIHLMGHMGMKPHKCEFCSKAFSDPSNLRAHLKIHTGQKNFKCSVCEKSFTQKAHVASHMDIHTGVKNLKCDYCDKMFVRRQDLRQHTLTHTQERQIVCPKCKKLFWKTSHLKKHLNSHEGKRDYVCEKCSKAYLTKYHLTRHLKICKGPKPKSSALDPEDDEGDSDDVELIDSLGSEDCKINEDLYSTDDSLSEHK